MIPDEDDNQPIYAAFNDDGELEKIEPEDIPARVTGYRPQTHEAVVTVNTSKALEKDCAAFLKEVKADEKLGADPRQLAMARTHFEDAFMHLNRAIFKPEDPFA